MIDWRHLDRRNFLQRAGGATLGVLGLGLSPFTGKAAAARRATHRHPFGATVNLEPRGNCPGGPVDLCTAQTFDSYVGMRMATHRQKVYLAPGQLPSVPPANWVAYVGAGGKLLISFKPRPGFLHVHSADAAAFSACVAGCRAQLGTSWRGVLWQEPNTGKSTSAGITAASTYQSYASQLTPLFRAAAPDIKLVYDPALCGLTDQCNAQSCVDYYPTDPAARPDGVYVDFYGSAYARGGTLDLVADLADRNGLPLGLGEWGPAAGGAFDLAKWTAYVNYLSGFFSARKAAGKPNGWMLLWASDDGGLMGQTNVVQDATDPKIPGIKSFVQALAG